MAGAQARKRIQRVVSPFRQRVDRVIRGPLYVLRIIRIPGARTSYRWLCITVFGDGIS